MNTTDPKYQVDSSLSRSERRQYISELKKLEREGKITYVNGGWYPGPNHPNNSNTEH